MLIIALCSSSLQLEPRDRLHQLSPLDQSFGLLHDWDDCYRRARAPHRQRHGVLGRRHQRRHAVRRGAADPQACSASSGRRSTPACSTPRSTRWPTRARRRPPRVLRRWTSLGLGNTCGRLRTCSGPDLGRDHRRRGKGVDGLVLVPDLCNWPGRVAGHDNWKVRSGARARPGRRTEVVERAR